ncbi:MAG: aldehyde dehydrogenase family protein, partial [Acidimicrobiia bacterium]|nr:aldehyde dehydrogenase family protein [Acidimicrobiia bacterium]
MTTTAGSIVKPEGDATIPPTSLADIDVALAELTARKGEWANTSLAERIDLLESVAANTVTVAEDWVTAACHAKAIPLDSNIAGEEWHSGPALTARNARLLRDSLVDILETGHPKIPGPVTSRSNGQTVAQVFPVDNYDKALWTGYRAEVWMAPGVTPGNLKSTMAVNYQPGSDRSGRVALVLGAGNISSIPPMDALSKLFIDNEVVVLKMNPVNEYIGPFLDEVFADFIARGYLRIVYGGGEQGKYLVHHALVDTVHITGSDKTHDAIVFGTGEEGEARKHAGDPILTKPITSELGNVSPVIVVPGPWSDADIEYQGRNIAAMLT